MRSLKKSLQVLKANASIEYIIVFIVITLTITGFIGSVRGIFNNYFQDVIRRVLQ